MEIEYALLADYAEMVGGKLYLMGGGWDTFTVADLPAQVRMAVAVGVRVGWEETNQQMPVRVVIEDDDGLELIRINGMMNVGRPSTLPPGATQLAQMAANVPLNIAKHGGYRIVIGAGEGAKAATERVLPFRISQPAR
jgi:hypothetical protein